MGATDEDPSPGRREVPQSLREWVDMAEAEDQLVRIKEEVNWDQEMSAITYLTNLDEEGPALLFENIKGYSDCSSLWNLIGASTDRFALSVGLDPDLPIKELIREFHTISNKKRAPEFVDSNEAPVNQNVQTGDDINVLDFPIPQHWPLDGGRYAGTADIVITRDPGEEGWHNAGVYRMMVHDENHVGLYMSPGKDAKRQLKKTWDKGESFEVVASWGPSVPLFMAGSQSYSKKESELEYVGGLLGQSLEMTEGEVTDLPLPANAEIVIEGLIHPEDHKLEGPFGEFQGYYGRPEDLAPCVEVKAVHHRDNPIHANALMAEYPACELSAMYTVFKSARIMEDLEKLGVPGVQGAYTVPQAANGFGMTVISIEQQYAGHSTQALNLVAQCPGGAYFTKWIVVVDDDVDPTNISEVLWAMSTRCNPVDDIDIERDTWSTWLDPSQNPPEERPYGSKALINACIPHKHYEEFSTRTKIDRKMYDQVTSRWKELNLPGDPPELLDEKLYQS